MSKLQANDVIVNFLILKRLTEEMEAKKRIFALSTKLQSENTCYFCLSRTNDVCCSDCEADIIREAQRCFVCAKQTSQSEICGNCMIITPAFSRTTVLFNYEYPTKKPVLAFKFKKHPALSHFFADRLLEKITSHRNRPEALIPVPLHKRRQRLRGYNQSLELARRLGNELKIKVNTNLCKRIVNTDPQSELPLKSRKENVKNAFVLNKENAPKHIALVDDVITTGSTINEIAQLFKKAGCEHIEVWAIART